MAAPRRIKYETLVKRLPAIRQSLLSNFDNCALSTAFDLQQPLDWSTQPQARGQMFHRWVAEVLRTLKRENEKYMPRDLGLQILIEVLHQRDVPPEDFIRVPFHQLPELKMACVKWCKDTTWNVDYIVSIEERFESVIQYEDDDGIMRDRVLTGQIDVLLADPNDREGAIIVDWKDTWGLPPEQDTTDPEKQMRGISYEGYFQQRFYGWLILKKYPHIERVTLREFYHRKNQVREATLHRKNMEYIEQELAQLVAQFDRVYSYGLDPDVNKFWKPSPGKHCTFCLRPEHCPIKWEDRGEGAIETDEQAAEVAARRQVAKAVVKKTTDGLKVWANVRGAIPLKSAKGRQVVGFRTKKKVERPTLEQVKAAQASGVPIEALYKEKVGTEFKEFVPETSDRGPEPVDIALEDALNASIALAEKSK